MSTLTLGGGPADFYAKQKSPIYDGKGNVTGYNHGYGNIEYFDKPIPDSQYKGPGHSLGDDQISEADAKNISPGLGNILDQIDNNNAAGNIGNKIDTSNQNNKMANGSGTEMLSNYLGNARNITPQWRKRDMVDLELSRGGRTSAFIPVGQHRDSPHLGYTNDFANAPGGFLNWYSGGQVSPSGAGNIGQQTEEGNIGGQQASGQGSAAGAGNYGGPNINISNVNNPQAVANTGTIENSTISNPSTGEASQTTTDNTNTNTNTNTPVVTPIAGGTTPVAGGTTPVAGGTTPVAGGTTPVAGGTTPVAGGTTPVAGGDTRFSDDFATKEDAQNWLNQYYVDTLGREANFDDQFSDASTNASYWINELSKGISTKDKVMSDIQLNPEFTNRKELVDQYRSVLGRDPLESELDALTGPGGQWLTGDTSAADISKNQLQQSAEFQGRNELVQLWNQHLGKNPTEAELDKYVGAGGFNLTNYTSADDVLQNVILPQKNQGGGSSSGGGGGGSSSGGGGQSYGGGTQAQNYITNQSAYEAEQASRAQNITHSTSSNVDSATQSAASTNLGDASTTVDDWLTDFYTEHGINQGKVDQGGRDYWTSALANKSKAEVEKDILWAAANN